MSSIKSEIVDFTSSDESDNAANTAGNNANTVDNNANTVDNNANTADDITSTVSSSQNNNVNHLAPMWNCPNCGNKIHSAQTYCKACGWVKPKGHRIVNGELVKNTTINSKSIKPRKMIRKSGSKIPFSLLMMESSDFDHLLEIQKMETQIRMIQAHYDLKQLA